MSQRMAISVLLSCAVLGDAALGALQPAIARPPLLSLAILAGVALVVGARAGMVIGFVVGVMLDMLSGPAWLAGMHTLTALLIGVVVGLGRQHVRHASSALATVAGGVAVPGAAVLAAALHRLLGPAVRQPLDVVVQALAVGAIVTPIVQRTLLRHVVRPLLDKSPAS